MRLPKRLQRKRAETNNARLVVAGLRNPGPDYQGTRHNVGYEVVTKVAERAGVDLGRAPSRVPAQVAILPSCVLAAPVTFMNDSGRAVRAVLDYWKVSPADMLVVHDDIDLAFGRLRLQVGGGSGGHNDYSRLKLGVGRPPGSMDPAAYVLQRFSKAERAEVDLVVEEAADVVETWFTDRARAQEMAAHRGRDA